jgi:hypothetical protein
VIKILFILRWIVGPAVVAGGAYFFHRQGHDLYAASIAIGGILLFLARRIHFVLVTAGIGTALWFLDLKLYGILTIALLVGFIGLRVIGANRGPNRRTLNEAYAIFGQQVSEGQYDVPEDHGIVSMNDRSWTGRKTSYDVATQGRGRSLGFTLSNIANGLNPDGTRRKRRHRRKEDRKWAEWSRRTGRPSPRDEAIHGEKMRKLDKKLPRALKKDQRAKNRLERDRRRKIRRSRREDERAARTRRQASGANPTKRRGHRGKNDPGPTAK